MRLKSFYASELNGYFLYGLWNNVWPGLRTSRNNVNLKEQPTVASRGSRGTPLAWWEKPGLGLMFQIEARPGWSWQRNFDRFNASLKGPDGTLQFNGPSPRMRDWVAFSKRIGTDYHLFEAKWHDGSATGIRRSRVRRPRPTTAGSSPTRAARPASPTASITPPSSITIPTSTPCSRCAAPPARSSECVAASAPRAGSRLGLPSSFVCSSGSWSAS